MHKNNVRRAVNILGSSGFFWTVMAIFLFETLWLVFSAVYPMAFDEDFHLGVIKIYSHHWLPFITTQSAAVGSYGAVSHDPSYLYQYLMSFPYRLLAMFTHDQTIQVIFLRLINVVIFAASIFLFRKVLLKAKLSRALTNFSLLLFVLIPVVPLLAAEVNYDNLTTLMVAVTCLLVAGIIESINKKYVPLTKLAALVVVCLLSSLIKYAFLPVFAAAFISTFILLVHNFGAHGFWRKLWQAVKISWRKIPLVTKIILPALMVISLGMFSQRYLYNIADYKTPIPKCDKVLSTDECMSYGPFARNYTDAQSKSPNFHPNIVRYSASWAYGTWFRLFFVINGDVSSPASARYQTYPPLITPSIPAVAILVAGLVCIFIYWRKILKDYFMRFLALTVALYLLALFADDYTGYVYTAHNVAINGRYLIPIFILGVALVGRAFQLAFANRDKLKLGLAIMAIVLFIQGGGILPFMLFSDHNWYWPNHYVVTANHDAKKVAQKFVIFDRPIKIFSP